ncbi:MAG TPA: MFS transporter [Anaerolineae bacterium]
MSSDPDPRIVAARHFRRNYICGLLNGAFFGFVDSVASPYLVLSLFVNTLGGSNFLVGLLPAINNGGWFLPQFLISHRLQQLPRKKGVYDTAALVRVICWVILVVSTFLIGNTNATLLLLLFFIPYTVYSLAAGFAGAPFMDIVAKTIPVNRRGTFFGQRDLSGAMLAIGGSYIVSYFLNPGTAIVFPLNFAYLLLITGIAVVLGLGSFSFVVEPVEATPVQGLTFRDQLHSARVIFLRNKVYRRFLLTRVAIAIADIATPFYAIYATRVLNIPLEIIGIYIAATTGASLFTNPLLSRLSDRRGHRIVLLIAATGMVTMPALAVAFGLLPAGPALGLPFGLVFAITGITRTAGNIAYPSYLLEIAPAGERPLYIGFTNTILGIATFLPVVGGILLDLAGFRVILLLALIVAGIAWSLAKGMVEPRQLVKPISP